MPTVSRSELVAYLDTLLSAHEGRDHGPNGLQVEGGEAIDRVLLGVTASLALIEKAVAWDADALVVHHGLFWRGAGELRVERALKRRLALLLAHDINLLAYHLPLDRHPEVGNNAVLARQLGATQLEPAFSYEGLAIGVRGLFDPPLAATALFARISGLLEREPLIEAGGPQLVRTIGIVTGGAPRLVEDAVRMGLDLFLTGEANESAVHVAREERIHFVAAGHHATERGGVQALAAKLRERFGIETRFVDLGNPV